MFSLEQLKAVCKVLEYVEKTYDHFNILGIEILDEELRVWYENSMGGNTMVTVKLEI